MTRKKSTPKKSRNPSEKSPAPVQPQAPVSDAPDPHEEGFRLNTHYFLFFLMFVVFAGCFSMLLPYINTIMLALILSLVVSPVHERIYKALNKRQNLAALTTCLLITLVVVLPLLLMLAALFHQGVTSFNAMYQWIAQGKYQVLLDHPFVMGTVAWLDKTLPDIRQTFPSLNLADMELDKLIMNTTSAMAKKLLNQSGQLAGNIGAQVGKFFLMIVIFFFLIRDEKKIQSRLLHLLPLSTSQEQTIITKIKDVSKSALLGTLVTSLAQGIAGGLAFTICGLPGLFWGTVMVFASLIPMVGTALIWVPACGFLLISGHIGYAVFMLIWCVVVVGGIDNILRPMFMQGGAEMSTLLIFLSILGGLSRFGLIGLLYGPLIFGLALVLIYIYSVEFKEFLTGQDSK